MSSSRFIRSAVAASTIVALSLPVVGFAKSDNGNSLGKNIRQAVKEQLQQMNGVMNKASVNMNATFKARVQVDSPRQCTVAFREFRKTQNAAHKEWHKSHKGDAMTATAHKELHRKMKADQKDATKRLKACLRGESASSSSNSSVSSTSSTSSVPSASSVSSTSSKSSSSKSSLSNREACIAKCPDGYEYRKCVRPGLPIYYFADPCLTHQGSSKSSSSKSSSSSLSSSSSVSSSSLSSSVSSVSSASSVSSVPSSSSLSSSLSSSSSVSSQ